ncbi:MAG: prepilin-type N-terminal cleavage/methylation domain-containing protein [Candidatus Staskawiczbacteria bacterium]|nr:prepilin-type N-terminal cleavage/methylation domain-containing protein [Candidatus Staskawiczbacteria bacterium]MBI3337166.1 prepilin-type N-terminal cleavage/methylation domain-containing protein [Candidatus Staskawiczbacteria bacterium]
MFHVPCFKEKKGVTIVEILVVIFIITIFSSILVISFPKITRQFTLTRAVYKMSQDLRRVQDMGFSGQKLQGVNAKGYGVYINLDSSSLGNKKYIMYADAQDDQQYDFSGAICGEQLPNQDCVIETIDLNQTEPGVIMDRIEGTVNNQEADINFKPPNPTVTITSLSPGINRAQIIFALESDLLTNKIVSVNTAGLIETK